MITYRSKGIHIAEVWFDEIAPASGIDVVLFLQYSRPVKGSIWREKCTLIVDLKSKPEEIFNTFNKDTRKDIRRARDKDQIICESQSARDIPTFDNFFSSYNRFAIQKKLPTLKRSRMEAYAFSGSLDLSVARAPDGQVLVWHSYLLACNRARGLYAGSLLRESKDSDRRNLIGRANRYLHWEDMLRFKEAGVEYYDFGGWYAGHKDEALLNINRYKEEFGTKKIYEYDCELPLTLQGKAALWLYHRLARLKH